MIKTIDVKFPPNNEPHTLAEAESIRNHRVDDLLSEALHSGRITQSDIDEYKRLYHELVCSADPDERAKILKRMSEILPVSDSAAVDDGETEAGVDG